MENLEQKLNENDLLTRDPVSRFMYFRATEQEEKAKAIANEAFLVALSEETREGIIKDLSGYANVTKEGITSSLCLLAQNGPYKYALKLATEYEADTEIVEESVYARLLHQLSGWKSRDEQTLDFIKEHNWNISESKRRDLLNSQYASSIGNSHKNLSRGSLQEAYRAMHCAELLDDEALVSESRKEVFKQNLWNRNYNEADEIDLNPDIRKNMAIEIIKINCRSGYYYDAKKIAQKYVPELTKKIGEMSGAFALYASKFESV